MSDMVRGLVVVNTVEECMHAYDLIKDNFVIIRIKNKLLDPLQLIHMNVMYNNAIVCEIQVKLGHKPSHFDSVHFLYELARVDSYD